MDKSGPLQLHDSTGLGVAEERGAEKAIFLASDHFGDCRGPFHAPPKSARIGLQLLDSAPGLPEGDLSDVLASVDATNGDALTWICGKNPPGGYAQPTPFIGSIITETTGRRHFLVTAIAGPSNTEQLAVLQTCLAKLQWHSAQRKQVACWTTRSRAAVAASLLRFQCLALTCKCRLQLAARFACSAQSAWPVLMQIRPVHPRFIHP